MADDFGLKIGLEGEKEFKKALADINSSFKVLGSEMKLVESQFDKNDNSVQALTARNTVLNKEIEAQKQKVETLRSALQNAADSFGETDRRTQAWQVQLNNAEAALNGMERELKQNNEALDGASDGLNDAADQADDFGNEISDAGKKSDNAGGRFEKLGGICKAVGAAIAASFAAVSAAAVAVGKSLVDMAVDGAAYADTVLTESTVTGIATDKLQEYMYAAELVDVSTETLTKSMAKQIKSMKSVQDGSKTMAAAYDALGVSVTGSNGNLRDSDTVYWELIDALGKVENETERDALAMQVLGKSAQELNPLIEARAGRMKELGDQAKEAGYVVSDEMLAAYGALDDNLQYLKVGAEGAKNALGTVLLPVLTELSGTGVDLLSEFTKGIQDANGDIGKMSDVIGEILPRALDAVMEYVPELLEVIGSIIGALGQAIIDNLPTIVESASEIIVSILSGLIAGLPQITEGALQLLLALADGILDNLPMLVETAAQVIVTLANGLGAALPQLIPAIIQAIITIVTTLLANMDQILAAAMAIIQGLADGLLNALPILITALPQIITSIIAFITGNLPQIIEMGIQLVIQLAAGLIQAIPQLIAAIPQIITALIEGLGQALPAVANIGKNIVQGLWEGIKSLAGWIGQKVSGFFSGIVDGAKRLLGIRSPSRVFAGIGENMGLGLGEGFTDTMKSVEKDMQKAIPTDFQIDMNSVVSGTSGLAGTAQAFNVTIPLTIDGTTLTRIISQIQWSQNTVTVRNLGTV